MEKISADELKKKMDANEDFILVDVLTLESFKGKHLPRAINIPVQEIENKASGMLFDKNKRIIVYCASKDCNASPTAAKKLEVLGYTDVIDFETGLAGWQEAGYDFEISE
jgi:rhodanese-related sulfurtransferase